MTKSRKMVDDADSYAVRLMQQLVVPAVPQCRASPATFRAKPTAARTGCCAADEALHAAKRLGRNRVIGADRLLAEFVGLRRAGRASSGPGATQIGLRCRSA
ncbi:hypothetical protein [Bradyrhizobium sp. USDA 4486]